MWDTRIVDIVLDLVVRVYIKTDKLRAYLAHLPTCHHQSFVAVVIGTIAVIVVVKVEG